MDITELEELQKKYYDMFTELKEARPAITSETAYNVMANNIFEQYRIEAELLRLRLEIKSEKEKYEILYRQSRLIPARRRRFFRSKPNEAAFLLECELEREIQREFDERERELFGTEDDDTEEFFDDIQEEDREPVMAYSEGEYYEEVQDQLEEPNGLLIEGKTE